MFNMRKRGQGPTQDGRRLQKLIRGPLTLSFTLVCDLTVRSKVTLGISSAGRIVGSKLQELVKTQQVSSLARRENSWSQTYPLSISNTSLIYS